MKIFWIFLTLLILSGVLFMYWSGYLNDAGLYFEKTKSEVLEKDGRAYLYKINEGEKDWFVATNVDLESKGVAAERVSENIFWDPEHCAQMLTLTVDDNLYFFESKFKGYSSTEFYDLIYKFNLKENRMKTFRADEHVNVYSVILEQAKIYVFYKQGDGFYKAQLLENDDTLSYQNIVSVKEDDIVYRDWKGNLEVLDKMEGLKYFIIQ